ncbi:MAG: hypothetical protein AABX12_04645 [Nanoarchaeota archaeon]
MTRSRIASQLAIYLSLVPLAGGCSYSEEGRLKGGESSRYLATPSIIVIEPPELRPMPIIKADPKCDSQMVRGLDNNKW